MEDAHWANVTIAFPKAEPGTPLAGQLAEVKSLMQAQLLKSDAGRGHEANLQILAELKMSYDNKAHPGQLLTEEKRDSKILSVGYFAGSNPFATSRL